MGGKTMIDKMHHVATVLWHSQSCRSCVSDLSSINFFKFQRKKKGIFLYVCIQEHKSLLNGIKISKDVFFVQKLKDPVLGKYSSFPD